jgi:hypothetical protein
MGRINPQAPFSGLTLQTSQNVQLQNRMPNLRLGAVSFGPRSGSKGRFAYVLTQNKQQILLQNQKIITQTGASSPLGAMVQGTMPPVLSGQNLTYVVIGTRDGDELAAYDGQRLYTYLKSGDTLYNNPKPIDRIFFGYTAQQANRAGALAFVVSHPDKTASLVLGVPV